MYLALYRKYRPKTFEDVLSQPHITLTLKREVMNKKTAHAYLFTGPRGTGKTTCSKILAMAVNCQSPVDGNPCLECESCKAIESGSTLDVTEIDAASNNGVDNIRQLRDEASFTPVFCKYRVYIIDETHMLSPGAFNALLKIMEEPPEHVKFILATTEAHKVPATIVSRCQRFDFRRIKSDDIKENLLGIAKAEGFSLKEDAAELIARLADGGMRDALSITDQCVAFSSDVDIDTVSAAAGIVGREYLFELTDCIVANDPSNAILLIDKLYSMSKDLQGLLEEMINHFRNIMLTITLKNPTELIAALPGELEKIKDYTTKIPLATLLLSIGEMQECLDKMSRSSDKRLSLELCFIKLCTPLRGTGDAALTSRIEKLEAAIKNIGSAVVQTPVPASKPKAEQRIKEQDFALSAEPQPTAKDTSDQENTNEEFVPLAQWADILLALSKVNMPLCGALNGSKAFTRSGFVYIGTPSTVASTLMKQENNAARLISIIEEKTGMRYKIKIKSTTQKQGFEAQEEKPDKLSAILDIAKHNGIQVNEDS